MFSGPQLQVVQETEGSAPLYTCGMEVLAPSGGWLQSRRETMCSAPKWACKEDCGRKHTVSVRSASLVEADRAGKVSGGGDG